MYCVVCIEFGGLVAEVVHVWWSRYIMGRSRDSSLLRCGLVAEVLHVWWSRYIMGRSRDSSLLRCGLVAGGF